MKKLNALLSLLLIVLMLALTAGCGGTVDLGTGTANSSSTNQTELGKYSVVIDSCRLTKDYDKKDVVIVKYIFTNVSDDEPAAFYLAFSDNVYQNGVGLNEAYFLPDSAKYDSGNQTKQIKKGATLNVEVAYELNDKKSDITVEVEELFSFSDKKITKTFSIK